MRRMATRVKNQIHATLAANWIKYDYSDLFVCCGTPLQAK